MTEENDDADAQELLADAVGDDDSDDSGSAAPTKTATDDAADTKRATDLEREVEKWKKLARKHEDRARTNAEAASQTRTVEEQLAELRKTMSDRDARDAQRSAEHALDKVHARLAEAGIKRDDVNGLLELVDSTSLLSDGKPDDTAIARLADSLTRVAGRVTPDPDQGRKGGSGPADMTTLIRRAAGYST